LRLTAEAHHLDKQKSISIGESHGAVNTSSYKIEKNSQTAELQNPYFCQGESDLTVQKEGLVMLR